jgi:hypothetical protein
LHKGIFRDLFVARQEWWDIREVAERLKAHAWKACIQVTVSRVRIPSSLQVELIDGEIYNALDICFDYI